MSAPPEVRTVDLAGVGVGPANLSLAALAHSTGRISACFFDGKPEFAWHPGLMLPEADLQVTFLKDLVTLADPTSPYSYLNFLHLHGRIFRSLVAQGMHPSRREFEQYYRWVAGQLPSVHWDRRVKSVELVDGRFELTCEGGDRARSTALVLGSGQEPHLPEFAEPLRGPQLLHGGELLLTRPATAGRRVLVVGAGQSGAEVVNHLLSDATALPRELTWLSSRPGFLPIDDSPFTNEWFMPPYVEHFRTLPAERRAALLRHQRLASDGVSESLLRAVYRRLYRLDVEGAPLRHRLVANRRVTAVTRQGEEFAVTVHDGDRDRPERCAADVIVFCTGYRHRLPDYLEPLRELVSTDADGGLLVRPDYSLDWDGPQGLRIYVQNLAEHTHGIADPNLSLASWRGARIVNSLLGHEHYRTGHATTTSSWSLEQA
ncbi:lysine N(6)-hydroxylase/L-ornithine N(5)-oxygenase family protein [Kitasatospora sp. NPDC051853]|uniref:lysine N(6)-hydroxylase/L-ornithine N(5)-oxygenase family protein n=1 Tax=Kitasatospora sp. NPDC051853 TaxID=3364058 RepID=UPI0037B6C218